MNTITMLLTFALGATLAAPSGPSVDRSGEIVSPSVTCPCWEAEMAEAYELRLAGENRAAHRKYRAVARSQLAAGEFPGDALWQAAEISFVERKLARAAQELDQVARHAREYGHLNLEVRALLEAGVLHHRNRRSDLALDRLTRVEQLRASPELSDEVRAKVSERLTTGHAEV